VTYTVELGDIEMLILIFYSWQAQKVIVLVCIFSHARTNELDIDDDGQPKIFGV
jgi:hypothetical protein